MSLRKSSRRRKGSKSVVLPKPKARRRWTPAPSMVGLDLMTLWTGRMDMVCSFRLDEEECSGNGLTFNIQRLTLNVQVNGRGKGRAGRFNTIRRRRGYGG